MDAAPDFTIRVERVPEAYSGMKLVRIAGWWDAASDTAGAHVEVRYDGQPATQCELILAPAAEVPSGKYRFNFGTQLPEESDGTLLEVVVMDGTERTLYRKPLSKIGTEPTATDKPNGFLSRTLRAIASGEAFSLWRWHARFSRVSEKLLVLRQRVRSKLLSRRYRPRAPHDAYVENTRITPRLRSAMQAKIDAFRHRPLFSILMPVYNVDPRWLKEAIASVQQQVYPHWELCLADDKSTRPDLIRYLDNLPSDPRIKLVRRAENGHICRATNSAAELATGEFVCLLDNDDELAPHALFAVTERLQQQPLADLIYSDEDKINERGRRYDPQFKPDWSPELLLSYNYINHFTVMRRSVFETAGRFRPGYEGSQDHDLLLRATELTDRIQHVPQILYHWRALPESTASSAGVKPIVHTSGRRAVEEALQRRGIAASLVVPLFAQKLNLPVLALDGPDDGPRVAVLIVGDADAARRTVRNLAANTSYRNVRTDVVSSSAALAEALNGLAAQCDEELLLVLEAGLEATEPRWLSRLVANLLVPGVGAVGAVIRDPARRFADAGPVLGQHDGIAPAPAFAGLQPGAISYYFYGEVTRNSAAISGRCLLTRRATFERLGGFDSRRFPESLWDVDYGLRVRELGQRCATVGGAELIGNRSPQCADPSALLALKRIAGRLRDPFHNPNCSERQAWTPSCDSPLSLASEAVRPPVRALVVAHNLNNPEGAPRYLSEIVLGLHDRGAIAPVVYSPLGGAGARVYEAVGIPAIVRESAESRRFVDGLWTPREFERAQIAAARLLRDQRPEVVVANTLTTFPFVEAAARAGIPAVWIIHESYSREHLLRLFPPFARKRVEAAFALAARVVPASHDTAALFAHLDTRGNFRVIHNGLDPKPFDDCISSTSRLDAVRRIGADTDKRHIIAVGTVCERKGQHALVEAAAILARERSDFVVHLVGARTGIPYADYVRNLVRRRGLEAVVRLVPETDSVWAYYRAADAFACTSHMETFSRAVLEAEAFGLPIISTPCCGLNEQVVWGANAMRFDFGDSSELATHLARLLSDDGLRQRMAVESRALFDVHLDEREMLDRYGAVILAAARQGSRASTALHPEAFPLRRAA